MPTVAKAVRPPLTVSIVTAVANLVADAQTGARKPAHSEIDALVADLLLSEGDPNSASQNLGRKSFGKSKRVSAILNWAMDNDPEMGEVFVTKFVAVIRGHGGFRPDSPNFVGRELIANAQSAFKTEGFELNLDGELRPLLLDNLSGVELTKALESYARRAQRGAEDAALVVGTGKDLLEATAAHVLQTIFGSYPTHSNFPLLLGQAFVELGLKATSHDKLSGEATSCRLERALYESGCAVNALRNKEGSGHGRPWLPGVSEAQARIAIQVMGTVAELLLDRLRQRTCQETTGSKEK